MFLFHLETLNYFFFLSCSKSKHIVYNEGSITLELKSARQLLILHQCRDYPVRAKHGPATLEGGSPSAKPFQSQASYPLV